MTDDRSPARRSARSLAAEARFYEMIKAAGGTVLEPVWLGTMHPTRVRCAAGHVVTPRPNSVRSYEHFCRVCAASANEKLTPEIRREIARLYVEENLSTITLGPMFNISQGHVSKVLKDEGVTARPSGRAPQFDPSATKICEVCGADFRRGTTRSGREEKVTRFAERKTCTKRCRYIMINEGNRARWSKEAAAIGTRPLVAKTCPLCEELLPAWRFQKQQRGFYATNCARCNQRERMAQMDPEKRARILNDALARSKAENDRARDHAWRNGEQWTGPELELVAREDLSVKQVAAMIGRTPYAVSTRRWLLNIDPMTDLVAGLPRQRRRRRSGS